MQLRGVSISEQSVAVALEMGLWAIFRASCPKEAPPSLILIESTHLTMWREKSCASINFHLWATAKATARQRRRHLATKWAKTSAGCPREGAWLKDKMYVGGRVTLSCCGNIKNSPTNLCEAQGHHPKWSPRHGACHKHPVPRHPPPSELITPPELSLILWQTTDRLAERYICMGRYLWGARTPSSPGTSYINFGGSDRNEAEGHAS